MTRLAFNFLLCILLIYCQSVNADQYVVKIETSNISYTEVELNWLNNAPEIILLSQIKGLPKEYVELNTPVSIETSSFFKKITQETGLVFKHKTDLTWSQVVDLLNQTSPIIIPAVKYHQNLTQHGLYTLPFNSITQSLYTRSENQEINSLSSLNGKKVAVISATTDIEELKKYIPDAVFIKSKNGKDSLKAVLDGKADALINEKSSIVKIIKDKKIKDLKQISLQSIAETKLHLLISKNHNVLRHILGKAINKIQQEKQSQTKGFWHSIYYESSSSFLIQIVIVLSLALFFVYIAHRKEQSKLFVALEEKNKINDEIIALKNEAEKKNKHQTVALAGSDEGVWDWDLSAGTYYLSSSWLKVLGYEANQIQPDFESYANLINPEQVDKVLDEYEKLIKGIIVKFKQEFQIRKGNSQWLWIETRGKVVERDENGKPTRCAGIHFDISDRIALDEALRKSKQTHMDHIVRLDQQNKDMQRTQKKLRDSENKAKSIIEMAKEAIVVVNSHSKIVSWNKGAEKLFGYTAEEMDWAPLKKIIPDDYSQSYLTGMDTKENSFELEGLHREGTKIPIELSTNSWDANDGIYSSSIIRDLTERKKMEHALSEQFKKVEDSQRFLNTLFDSQKQILIVTTGEKIQDVNQFFLDFFNISKLEEFTLKNNCISDLFKPGTSRDFLQASIGHLSWIEYVVDNPKQAHKAIITQKNQDYIFDVDIVEFEFKDETLYLAVFSDITELDKAKNLAQGSLAFTEQLIEGLSSPFYFQDKEFKFQKVNSAFCKLMGKPKRKIISTTILDLLEKDEAELFHESDKKLLQNQTQIEEISISQSTGIINIIVYKAAMYDKNNNFDGIIGLVIDITERKKIEKELAESKALMTGSIEYSSLIQQAITPDIKLFEKYFKDYFIIWKPRDVVGGDIFFLDELRSKDECLIMVIDCTGHGVPGAFVTMLVKAVEKQIINDILLNDLAVSPAHILKEFNAQIKLLLRQHNEDAVSNAGFDGGVLYINYKEKIAKYSGAETPLFLVQNDKFSVIKGDRHSIGYKKSDVNFQFTEHTINIKKPTKFYLSTDGFFDQNGGNNGFPMGKKVFMNQLEELSSSDFSTQKTNLLNMLESYKKDEDVNDDITVIGVAT